MYLYYNLLALTATQQNRDPALYLGQMPLPEIQEGTTTLYNFLGILNPQLKPNYLEPSLETIFHFIDLCTIK